MIKLTFCLRRLPHLTREEFQTYWREQHAPLVAHGGDRGQVLGRSDLVVPSLYVHDGRVLADQRPHGLRIDSTLPIHWHQIEGPSRRPVTDR